MGRNTSVSSGDYFEGFAGGSISAGRYKNARDVIRTGLRLLKVKESKIKYLKQGFRQGIDRNFNAKTHLKNLKATKGNNG